MKQTEEPFESPASMKEYVKERLGAGIPEFDVVEELTRRGVEQTVAQEFVRHAEAEHPEALNRAEGRKGMGHLAWGLVLFILGAAITAGTHSSGGGTYMIMWGAMVWGTIHIAIGLRKFFANADRSVKRRIFIGVAVALGVVVLALVAAAAFGNNNAGNGQTQVPSDDFVVMDDRTNVYQGGEGSMVNTSGTVSNTHATWSMTNVQVEVRGLGYAAETLYVPVRPGTLAPGATGAFSTNQKMDSGGAVKLRVVWKWVAP